MVECKHVATEQVEGAPEGIVRCLTCGKVARKTEVWARPCGYLRPISGYNLGKKAEFDKRKTFRLSKEI